MHQHNLQVFLKRKQFLQRKQNKLINKFDNLLNLDIENFDKIKVLELDEYFIKKQNLSQKQI